jgi:uracil-DNA glycosylase family 4
MTLPIDPAPNCPKCKRLVAFRKTWQKNEPNWHNAPVPSFGSNDAEVVIVGLAPGLRGANCTGRPFTGDWAGDLLFKTLDKHGFTTGTYDRNYSLEKGDNLELKNIIITNAVRCVPPENKPIGEEMQKCRPFLVRQIKALKNLKIIMALGGIAHNNVLSALELRRAEYKFGHNAVHDIGNDLLLIDSYHCSRYNTNTGRLTDEMFNQVFSSIKKHLNNSSD